MCLLFGVSTPCLVHGSCFYYTISHWDRPWDHVFSPKSRLNGSIQLGVFGCGEAVGLVLQRDRSLGFPGSKKDTLKKLDDSSSYG